MDDVGPMAIPMCPNPPKFTASDPATKEAPFGWVQQECTPKLYPAAKGQYIKEVVAEMERMNVTAVVFGDPASVQKWQQAAPGRVIPGTSFEGNGPGEWHARGRRAREERREGCSELRAEEVPGSRLPRRREIERDFGRKIS